jgi:hypothetical protein
VSGSVSVGGELPAPALVRVPRLPAAALSLATGGALALGSVGVLGASSRSGIPCVFYAVTGKPCPFHGLTHAVAALGAGDVGAALALNALAPLAVALALLVAVTLARGKPLAVPRAALWTLLTVVLVSWLARLAM